MAEETDIPNILSTRQIKLTWSKHDKLTDLAAA